MTTISEMTGIEGMKAARDFWMTRLQAAYEDRSERGARSLQRIEEHISAINEAIAKLSK